MIIHHAAMCGDEFVLWGETREEQAGPAASRFGKRGGSACALSFPYTAGLEAFLHLEEGAEAAERDPAAVAAPDKNERASGQSGARRRSRIWNC